MGIKHFFTWFKTNFPQYIQNFAKVSPPSGVSIDTFMIDLNGVIHTSAQRVFKYGNYAIPKSILGRKRNLTISQAAINECYMDVCASIEEMFRIANPQKRLVICIDGVAPQSKQNQQRQRRYRGAVEDPDNFFNVDGSFDTCSITPGTKFMDGLSKYIDWFIRKRISDETSWAMIDVVFSNEKVPGEGEHKLIDFIRQYGTDDETYCINALDADLFMLALATHKPNFYLLREDNFTVGVDYMYVDIGAVRKEIISTVLHWDGASEKQLINDFILICFLCGNDFLPNIPTISIMDKGLDTIINLYKINCAAQGHLTDENSKFITSSFKGFLTLIGASEKSLVEEKMKHQRDYIPDPLLDSCTTFDSENKVNVNFEKYKAEYNRIKFHNNLDVGLKYLEGCQWVLTYYTKGISDWTYIFPFHYSPFATDLAVAIDTYEHPDVVKITPPLLPFQQLLSVLPPKSARLLPNPLNELFNKGTSLSKFCPDTFVINYDGKKKKWEGVVELPVVDPSVVAHAYKMMEKRISPIDMKRNIMGSAYMYKFSMNFVSEFKSVFGNIFPYRVEVQPIGIWIVKGKSI